MLTTPQVREEVFSYVALFFWRVTDSTRGRKGFEPRTSGPLITKFVSVMEEGLGGSFQNYTGVKNDCNLVRCIVTKNASPRRIFE